MKTPLKISVGALAAFVLVGLGGCSNLSRQERNTALGAGVGAVGGNVISGGSTMGTLGGAAVGGVVGHEISK